MLEMKYFKTSLVAIVLLSAAFNTFSQGTQNCPLDDCTGWKIVEDSVFQRTFEWDDPEHSSPPTMFINCTFKQGAWMGGVDSVYFYKCKFINREVALGRSMKEDWQGTSNLTFDSCQFRDHQKMSLVTGRNRANPDLLTHENLVIKNCYFKNWGKDYPGNKLYHAVYLKGADVLVENNIFHNISGGSAISIRNSGVVRNNKVFRAGYGFSGIEYWNQFPVEGSKKLLIEGNTVVEPEFNQRFQSREASPNGSSDGAIWIASHPKSSEFFMDEIVVRNNMVVVLSNGEDSKSSYSGITIGGEFSAPTVNTKINVSGNFVIDLRGTGKDIILDQGSDGINNDYLKQNYIIREDK